MHRRAQTTHIASWIVCSALRWGLLWHDSRLPTAKGNEYKDTSTAPSNQMLLLLLCVFFFISHFIFISHLITPGCFYYKLGSHSYYRRSNRSHSLSSCLLLCVVWMGFFLCLVLLMSPALATGNTHHTCQTETTNAETTAHHFSISFFIVVVAGGT